MIRARIRELMILLVFLTGCTTTAVKHPTPIAAPASWSMEIDTATTTTIPFVTWWEELADEQLNQLVEKSLQNSADIQVAAARVKQARAFAKEMGANRLPQIEVGVAAFRERVSETSLPDTEGNKQTTPAYRQSNFAARLEVRYEVDLLGRLALNERAASTELTASKEELRAVRQWLAQEVVLAYADLRLADERTAFANEISLQLNILHNSEQERLKAGLIARHGLYEVERRLAETNDAKAILVQERHAALARLANLVGTSTSELQIDARVDYFARLGLSGALTPDLPATVIEQRADLAAAWQRALAASALAERARLERYPALSLTGSAGYVSEAFRRWLVGDALAWLAQAALQSPLFDAGRIEARAEQAHATFDELYAHYRKLVLNALAETETALSATRTARERMVFAEFELARRVVEHAATADLRSAGIGSKPELVEKEINQLTAADSLSKRRHDLLVAWANTQKALGR